MRSSDSHYARVARPAFAARGRQALASHLTLGQPVVVGDALRQQRVLGPPVCGHCRARLGAHGRAARFPRASRVASPRRACGHRCRRAVQRLAAPDRQRRVRRPSRAPAPSASGSEPDATSAKESLPRRCQMLPSRIPRGRKEVGFAHKGSIDVLRRRALPSVTVFLMLVSGSSVWGRPISLHCAF